MTILLVAALTFTIFAITLKIAKKNQNTINDTSDEQPADYNIDAVCKCDSCGASVHVNLNNNPAAFCPFCGSKLHEAEKLRTEILRAAETKTQQELEKEKIALEHAKIITAEKRRQDIIRENKRDDIVTTIMLIAIAAVPIAFFVWLLNILRR